HLQGLYPRQSSLPPQPRPRPLQELTSAALHVTCPGWITQLPGIACQSNQGTNEPVQGENEGHR
ncbi:hypothetical protein M9458_001107, partial [Cirrhinus mrigala]